MRVLTVCAHPNPKSFCHAILEQFSKGLEDGGHTSEVIDLSEGMLAKARSRARRYAEAEYELSLGSALDLPVESDSIDLLINTYLFDLLSEEDMVKALSEFARVLRPPP